MLRIEADALQAHLAIALFAFLDARADATLTIEQSHTLTRAVSSGHDDSTGRKRSVPQIANELASLTWDPTSGLHARPTKNAVGLAGRLSSSRGRSG